MGRGGGRGGRRGGRINGGYGSAGGGGGGGYDNDAATAAADGSCLYAHNPFSSLWCVCMQRGNNDGGGNCATNSDVLEKDLTNILMDKVPLKFGVMLRRLGNYEQIVPMDLN